MPAIYPSTLETSRADIAGSASEWDPKDPQSYAAEQVFTPFQVAKPADEIPYGLAENEVARDETNESAPGTTAASDSATFGSTFFKCFRRKRDAEFTEEDVARVGDLFQLEKYEARRVTKILKVNRDIRMKRMYINDTFFVPGTDQESAAVNWSSETTANARKDVGSAMVKGLTRCGRVYTHGMMNQVQFRQLWAQEKLRQSFSGIQVVGNEDPFNAAARKQLANQLGLVDIFVTNTMYNTANPGANLAAALVWPTDYVLLFNPAGTEKEMRFGFGNMFYHNALGGLLDARTFYSPETEKNTIRVGEGIDMKVFSKACAYLLKVNNV